VADTIAPPVLFQCRTAPQSSATAAVAALIPTDSPSPLQVFLVLCVFLSGRPPGRGRRDICQGDPARQGETREHRIPVLFPAGQKEQSTVWETGRSALSNIKEWKSLQAGTEGTYGIHKMRQCQRNARDPLDWPVLALL